MRKIHTPLGYLKSNKKFIAGAAALALVGGITPALINTAHAANTIYAPVGPQYFALSGIGNYLTDDYIEDIYIEDTDIADFYGAEPSVSDGNIGYSDILFGSTNYDYPADEYECYMTPFACIQGKEVGETEIVVEYSNRTVYIPLKSVKLYPSAFSSYGKIGGTVAGEGSLNGADDSLLKLRSIDSRDNTVSAEITGDRSWTVTASEDAAWYEDGAMLTWTIGDQLIGNGTYVYLMPVEGVDNLGGIESNEDKMGDAFLSIVRAIEDEIDAEGDQEDLYGFFESKEGDVAYLYKDVFDYGPSTTYEVALGYDNDKIKDMPEEIKRQAFAKLPEGVDDLYVVNASPIILACNYGECEVVGEFYHMAEDLTVTLDTSEATEPVADGYVRKWYATPYVFGFKEGDGFGDAIEADYDEENKTVTVTGPAGYYVYSYIDVEKPEEPEEPVTPLVPNTGAAPEKVAMVATATFAPLAAIAFGAFIARNRKKAANKLAKKHNHFE